MSEAVMEHTNAKLEAAIEDLRVKYERIRAEEEKQKAEKECAERCKAAAEAKKEELNDWSVGAEDPELEKLRQSRIASLKDTASAFKTHREAGHGDLREIVEEEFLKEVTSASLVVVHFFHPEFETCKVMDKHLRDIAARALQTKFLRLNATKAAFFVAKLKVKTLPTLVYFKDGLAIARQIGYDGLRITTAPASMGASASVVSSTAAASTDFSTASLARAMRAEGVFGTAPIVGRIDEEDEEEDDEDGGGSGGRTRQVLRAVAASAAASDPAAAMAAARQRMLEEIEASDDM